MVNFNILAGGYTSVISTFNFTSNVNSGVNGSLNLVTTSNAGTNPSWIQASPCNSSVIYATNEITEGRLLSFTLSSKGSLSVVGNTTSGGNGPANLLPLNCSNKFGPEVTILNFGSGNGQSYRMQSNLLDFVTDPAPPVITFDPTRPANESNPHQAVEVGDQLFVPDRGTDKVWRLNRTSDGTWNVTGHIEQPQGSGPRHMVVEDDFMYVLHEKSSNLTSQKIPSDDETQSSFITELSIVPSGGNSSEFAAAEIIIAPSNPSKGYSEGYIYCSNRKITGELDSRGDSIAIFSYNSNGTLALVNQSFTGLHILRGMVLDPSGQYLIAGAQADGGLSVFERTDGGASLTLVANTIAANVSSFVVY